MSVFYNFTVNSDVFVVGKSSSALVRTSTWFPNFCGLLNSKERYINGE